MPYVEAWNLDVQKTLPWGIVMNLGYNGSKGNRLDVITAPRALASSPATNPQNLIFNYEQAVGFSKFGAATVRREQAHDKRFCGWRELSVLPPDRQRRLRRNKFEC